MLALWITVLFLAEPLLICIFAAGVVIFDKDDTGPSRFTQELIAVCLILAIVNVYLGLDAELNSSVKATLVVIMLVMARLIVSPIILGLITAVIDAYDGQRSYPPTTTSQPWIFPGSHPPPGWTDED